MSTIERVARAICDRQHGDRKIADLAWSGYRKDYITDAIAAIRAIREPDGDLLAVGDKAIFNADGDWRSNACWRAMIDSILSEEEAKP